MLGQKLKIKYISVGITSLLLCFGIHRSKANSSNNVDLVNSAYIASLINDPRLRDKQPPRKIAVVGGGIGGTSSAYFLRQLFGENVNIDIYEPGGRLCGRVATVDIGGRSYESGGSIIHPKNFYAKSVAEKFGLKDANSIDDYVGFFDGDDFVLQTSTWSIISFFRMFWAFGFDLFRLNSLESEFMDKFVRIYDIHNKGQSFSSVCDLLHVTGEQQFINATKMTSSKSFSDNGIRQNMISVLVNGGLRSNYGQTSSEVNGFVGMVSMAGIQSGLWSVKGGNKLLCEKMFENSNVNLITEHAARITQTSAGQFSVVATESKTEKFYDLVVIATPINRDKSNIDVSDVFTGKGECPSATEDPRHYRHTVATFVKGKLNQSLFHCDSLTSCPGAIFTTKDLFYRSIGLHAPVDFDPNKGDSVEDTVYKVFSTDPLSETQLSQIFEGREENQVVSWRAYPQYSPPDRLDTFVLNEKGVYYTSPIEWAASAIEMSMISAKNIALLAFNKWYGIDENVITGGSGMQNEHSEL